MRRDTVRLLWLLLPAGTFFAAFFLLPLVRLFLVGGGGRGGFYAYASIVTDRTHFLSLLATLFLAAATTLVTLVVSGVAGVFLQRNTFAGQGALIAMLTLPLAFPGVVVGFMVIVLAGRQGLIGDISLALTGEKVVFAYSMSGLFMGYVYFSIPRTILTVMATAEKLDRSTSVRDQ
jgi:putative spermidine/putrescine transport system permease protein